MASSFWVLGRLLAVISFCGVHCHNVGRREPHSSGEYAVLSVPRFNIDLLLDTQHNYLTVRTAEDKTCYIVTLSEDIPRTPLHLIVHIYRHGQAVIQSEFRVQSEVSRSWLGSTLGMEYLKFCLHDRLLLLQTAPDFQVNEATQEPITGITSSPLIG